MHCAGWYTFFMSKLRVGVLRGGPSSEYDVSLITGGAVLNAIDSDRYVPVDLLVDRSGVWHVRGREVTIPQALRNVDVIFNAMHGEYGEDGTIQKVLNTHHMPYTGSGALASAVCMNKLTTKRHVESLAEEIGFKLAPHAIVDADSLYSQDITRTFDQFAPTAVIKPLTCGSSVGVTIAYSFPEFKEGVVKALTHAPKVLIEKYIAGREATAGVLEHFRGQHLYPLLPIEIIPPSKCSFFDYEAKYTSNETQEICPGNFSSGTKRELERFAQAVHERLGLRHYSRSDFIVAPDGIYFLEVNTLPGLTPASLIPKALKAVGCSFQEFISHLIGLALHRR